MKRKNALDVYVALFYGLLYMPLAVIFAYSFNDANRNVVWHSFTFKWYWLLLQDGPMLQALGLSLKVAVVSSFWASCLGLLASYAMTRRPKFRGRGLYASLLTLPLMMPEIVMGVGMLSFFVRIGVPLNFWSLTFAHAMIALPYTAASIRANLLSMRESKLEEAAMDLGASPWQAFWKVTLPVAKPAILSGALLAFTMSFEDFVTTFFIAGIGIVTLPIKIYSMMKFGVTPEINALACCSLAATLALVLVGRKLGQRKTAQPGAAV